jgi:serine/threonine protein kinase
MHWYEPLIIDQINILAERGRALLTDFGLIAIGDGTIGPLSVLQTGSIQYMAPELVSSTAGDAQDDEWVVDDAMRESRSLVVKTKAGDVFAYGRLIIAVRFAFLVSR